MFELKIIDVDKMADVKFTAQLFKRILELAT